jgi:hypothetical protein
MMKVMQHSGIVETTITRSDFTKHGLHLNMNGKEKMAALIKENINSIISVQQPSLIPIQWTENHLNTYEQEEGKKKKIEKQRK